jgi:hypothetical protein
MLSIPSFQTKPYSTANTVKRHQPGLTSKVRFSSLSDAVLTQRAEALATQLKAIPGIPKNGLTTIGIGKVNLSPDNLMDDLMGLFVYSRSVKIQQQFIQAAVKQQILTPQGNNLYLFQNDTSCRFKVLAIEPIDLIASDSVGSLE